MKRIGLLGGMSWESSALYYEQINRLVRERLGGLHSALCTMASVDFADVERMQAEDRWDEAATLLGAQALALEAAGADLLVLCTNTMHIVADQVQAAVQIPLLHLGDVTARAVVEKGVERVALLGTAFTMERPFLRDRLASHGLQVTVPDEKDRALVHRVIYEELVLGELREDSRRAYADVIGRLVADGAEGVILGCTEIEMLVDQRDSPVPLFATTRLHAQAAVDAALA